MQQSDDDTRESGYITPDQPGGIPGWQEGIPVFRIYTCGLFTIKMLLEVPEGDPAQARYVELSSERLCGRGPGSAQKAVKLFVSQEGRYATKDWLRTHLREGEEIIATNKRLENILSHLRCHLLCLPSGKKLSDLLVYVRATNDSGDGYRLADYPLVWVDVDALAWNVRHACLKERFGEDAFGYWQRAYELASRGAFLLEEPHSEWAIRQREAIEDQMRQSVRALVRLFLARFGSRAEEDVIRILSTYRRMYPTDEDALRPLLQLLNQRQEYSRVLEYYEQLEEALLALRPTKEDFPRIPHPLTTEIADFARLKLREGQQTIPPVFALDVVSPFTPHIIQEAMQNEESAQRDDQQVTHIPSVSSSVSLAQQDEILSRFSHAVTEGILKAARELGRLEGSDMDQLRRRILEQTIRGAGLTILAPHESMPNTEIAERFIKALARPSSADKKTLLYLEKRMGGYWQDRNDVSLPAWDLLPYVLEDYQRTTTLLAGSLLPTVRTHLCSIAGVAAMLIGELYYDMRNYVQARAYQKLAIEAASQANNAALEAVAWGRNSFAWTYDRNPVEARNSIQQAHRLVWGVNSTVRAWLAAVEAEIHSSLGDRVACLKALKKAARVENRTHLQTDSYWIHFDQSLLAGYQGASLLNLSNRGHRDLVQNAQTALQDALDALDPSMKRRQPTLLVDLAGTYIQQGDIEQGCRCATKAIDISMQINSKVFLQRLLALRSNLEPWSKTRYVQALDGAIEPYVLTGKV